MCVINHEFLPVVEKIKILENMIVSMYEHKLLITIIYLVSMKGIFTII